MKHTLQLFVRQQRPEELAEAKFTSHDMLLQTNDCHGHWLKELEQCAGQLGRVLYASDARRQKVIGGEE